MVNYCVTHMSIGYIYYFFATILLSFDDFFIAFLLNMGIFVLLSLNLTVVLGNGL